MEAEHSANYPTVEGLFQKGRAAKTTRYPGFSEANSRLNASTSIYDLNMSWVLFDFGLRAAKVESARQLLNAASGSRIEELQKSMLATARVFYQVQANTALLQAKISAERLAHNSRKAANAKYHAGAGQQTDRLQALESRTRALAISRLFVESASKSYDIAQGRYKAGEGSILELLRSQSDQASARQKRLESLVSWHKAKLQLAPEIGSLNIGELMLFPPPT